MLGFPGETEEQFELLYDFLKNEPFDRVGAFAFCPEDGTKAAKARLDKIMRMQQTVSLELNKKRIGKEYEVLIERVDKDACYGRSYAEAPDVDGIIKIINIPASVKPGDFVYAKITDASSYDLKGEFVK